MFGFRNVFSTRTLAAAAGLSALALMAPAAEAGPWPWGRSHGTRVVIQPRIVIHGGYERPHYQPVCDVVPADLKFTAFRSRDTVMVFATGTNHQAGFTTALTDVDAQGWNTVVTLRNTPRGGPCADMCSPFSVSAAICMRTNTRCLTVRVAGQSFEVPIVEVQTIS